MSCLPLTDPPPSALYTTTKHALHLTSYQLTKSPIALNMSDQSATAPSESKGKGKAPADPQSHDDHSMDEDSEAEDSGAEEPAEGRTVPHYFDRTLSKQV